MLEVADVETQKQHVGIGVIQSFGVGIITIGVEMVIAPNIIVVKRGVQIKSITKLGSGSSGISTVRNLNRCSTLLVATTRVVGIRQMSFTNLITIIHVNMTIDQPLISSMAVGRYRSTNVVHPRGGYQKPIAIIAPIFHHKDGHYCHNPILRKRVKVRLTLPKWGLGSPLGLPKLQSSIARVKTPCIGAFFISLERYQRVDVENGFA